MRFSVIKYEEDETVYYNPTAFCRDENVIIFPFKEFDNFYNDLVQNLNVVKNIIDDSMNPESTTAPIEDLEHVEDWINLIKRDVDLLLKFRMQTTLNSFKKGNSARIKSPQKAPRIQNKLHLHSKEKIQCLIGL